jgi:hypothetical protein
MAIKRGFKDASIETLKAVTLKLPDGFAQRTIDELLRQVRALGYRDLIVRLDGNIGILIGTAAFFRPRSF